MRIDTNFTVVVILAIWAPDSLEVEHVEVHINFVLLNQHDRKFTFIVREGAVLLVFTLLAPHLEIGRTELGLIFVGMVELLHTVMGPLAVLLLLAILDFPDHLRADLRLVSPKGPPSILVKVMVEGTALQVVILWILLTLVYLESEEVEEHDALSHADLPCVIPAAMHALIRLVVALVIVFVAPCILLLLCKLFLNGYLLLELLLSVLRDP